jgi:transcriptional regulator with XRE-family HTH domain
MVMGDQVATDGVLTWRLGIAFAHLQYTASLDRSDRMVNHAPAPLESMYPIGYIDWMSFWPELIVRARTWAGLGQTELAARAGTSRPTLSAYEHGRKAPTADTLERVLAAAGARLDVVPDVAWREVAVGRGRSCWVSDRLWRLPLDRAFSDVHLPLELEWSASGRRYVLRDRRSRARLYEVVLREGAPADLLRWVDGALLVDLWDEIVLPRAVREAWEPVLDAAVAVSASTRADRRGGAGVAS